MAEMLKLEYGLTALKVWIDTFGEGPQVRLALQGKIEGRVETLCEWQVAATDVGLPRKIDRSMAVGEGPAFHLPPAFLQELSARREIEALRAYDEPLWLHLVKPYGYLGMVPWEGLLVPALGVPVLRLPDFIVPPPRETRRALEVALCSSAPLAKDSFPLVAGMVEMARAIHSSVERRVRIHMFIDVERHGELGRLLQAAGLPADDIRVHDPGAAARYASPEASTRIADPAERLENPWLLWMRDSLGGRSVDVVHFLCHGYFANDQGALAVSKSPVENDDPRYARFIGPTQLGTFLTQVGAWAVAFSSPRENYSQLGLRALADTIGQARPGIVLHCQADAGATPGHLRDAYEFLFSVEPKRPPRSPQCLVYCQPHRVARASEFASEGPAEAVPALESPELSAIFEQEENVPSWLAAGQRFIEQARLEVHRSKRAAPSRRTRAASFDSSAFLDELQGVIARAAGERKTGGGQ